MLMGLSAMVKGASVHFELLELSSSRNSFCQKVLG